MNSASAATFAMPAGSSISELPRSHPAGSYGAGSVNERGFIVKILPGLSAQMRHPCGAWCHFCPENRLYFGCTLRGASRACRERTA